MSEPQKSKRFNLPKDFDSSDRQLAATLIMDQIVKRTLNNTDYNGKRFTNYSDSYANSLEFKIAKKSKTDPNLKLTGDMLYSMQVLSEGEGYVTIGYSEGTPENDKAVWAERSDNGPSRKFLGLLDSELEQIISEVRLGKGSENQAISTTTNTETISNILKTMDISFIDGEDENG